jgi:hypothetical protein
MLVKCIVNKDVATLLIALVMLYYYLHIRTSNNYLFNLC